MAFAKEDLRWYFRAILVANKFLRSPEFRAEISGTSLPLHLPPLDIEVAVTAPQLTKMLAHIGSSWTKLGESRPHFSVLTESRFLPKNIGNNIDSFWASGVAEVENIEAVLNRCGFNDLSGKTCVEYGCGLGRVTIPLAARFCHVSAYDISASHLALASQRAAAAGLSNVSFHHCCQALPELEECDFFYSRLVLQHNPPPVIREIIRLALASLRPGGIAFFGVPVYLSRYRFDVGEYLARPARSRMELHCLPQSEIFALVADAGCLTIEVREERSIRRSGERLSNLFIVSRPAVGHPPPDRSA